MRGGKLRASIHDIIKQGDIDYDENEDESDHDESVTINVQSLAQLYTIVNTVQIQDTGESIEVAKILITPNMTAYHVFKHMGVYNTNTVYVRVMRDINRAMQTVSTSIEDGSIYYVAYTTDKRFISRIGYNPDMAMFVGDVPIELTDPDDPESIVYNMDLVIDGTIIPIARERPYTDLLPCDTGPIPDNDEEAIMIASVYVLDNMDNRFTELQSLVATVSTMTSGYMIERVRDMDHISLAKRSDIISRLRSITRFFSFVKSYTTPDGVVHTVLPITYPLESIYAYEQFINITNLVSISDT